MRLLDEHGVQQYPFGKDGLLNLHCAARESVTMRPDIVAESNIPLTLRVLWGGQVKVFHLLPGVSMNSMR